MMHAAKKIHMYTTYANPWIPVPERSTSTLNDAQLLKIEQDKKDVEWILLWDILTILHLGPVKTDL